jgi:hypothetical protein
MFSERLENLIKAALKDGVLTEQEKNAIIKRAEAEGEDIDEVDIYIQSLMQEKQQQLAKEAQEAETARIVAQKKEREARMASEIEEQKQHDTLIRKCPVCGAIIPALTNVCPGCHHVINSYEADKEAMKLMEEILVGGNFGKYDKRAMGGIAKSAMQRNIRVGLRDLRFLRYFPSECLCEPLFRIRHFIWRKRHPIPTSDL